ncbi:hypothetical protein DAEQUDRAFT_246059 [Daedalea quercina L-15889]|uniref:Secreted protein n=1 Tax=Daedalea quercina L-15889 TaxID=1314783 RepID=A0A165QLL0_9APHY|nr:hypothetical protein DAEQUDRAFT_246059 [Daedalea quercina L-15889]
MSRLPLQGLFPWSLSSLLTHSIAGCQFQVVITIRLRILSQAMSYHGVAVGRQSRSDSRTGRDVSAMSNPK